MVNKNTNKQAIFDFVLVFALLLSLFFLAIALHGDARDFLLKEDGLVESASVLAYLLCAVYIIYKRKVIRLKYFFFLIVFFMLRELDFHKRFTTMGIFKARFFSSGNVPLIEKVIGALVILSLAYVSISIVCKYSKDFFKGFKKGSAVSYGILLTMMFLALSKTIDGLARKLKGFGIVISQQISVHAGAIEEILELGIPLIILFTLNAYFKKIEKPISE